MSNLNPSRFLDPIKADRPFPYWHSNDRLDSEELERQIRWMKELGFGAHIMWSGFGLVTPYLGKEWMEAVAQGLRLAKELDMEAWLYDEDTWSSGFAGGLILEARPDLECQVIFIKDSGLKIKSNPLAQFLIKEGEYWLQDDPQAPPKAKKMEFATGKGVGQGPLRVLREIKSCT